MNECRYGQYLFGQHQFAEAMEHFSASSLDLSTILCLFPMIKIPNVGASKDLVNVKESESGGPSPLGALASSTSETLEGNTFHHSCKPTSEFSLSGRRCSPFLT